MNLYFPVERVLSLKVAVVVPSFLNSTRTPLLGPPCDSHLPRIRSLSVEPPAVAVARNVTTSTSEEIRRIITAPIHFVLFRYTHPRREMSAGPPSMNAMRSASVIVTGSGFIHLLHDEKAHLVARFVHPCYQNDTGIF